MPACRAGLADKWLAEGFKWVCFFQDTNGLVFRALPAAIGGRQRGRVLPPAACLASVACRTPELGPAPCRPGLLQTLGLCLSVCWLHDAGLARPAGVSEAHDFDVNSLAVPRKAKEAIGAITKLTYPDGRWVGPRRHAGLASPPLPGDACGPCSGGEQGSQGATWETRAAPAGRSLVP